MRCVRWIQTVPLFALAACAPQPLPTATAKTAATPASVQAAGSTRSTPARENPLLRPSTLPFQWPELNKIKDADFVPAFLEGMAAERREIDAIARSKAEPTFENTIVAMERSGQLLTRVSKTFFALNAADTTPARERIESEMAPKLAGHRDAILLDPALFRRVDAVYQRRAELRLDPESAQLLERYEKQFLRAGAQLSAGDKAKLKEINRELSSLTTRFRQAVLKATKEGAVVVDDVRELDGLSPEQIGAAAEAAKRRGAAGKWVITLENTTIQPVLAQLKHRPLRERVFKASVGRGISGANGTAEIISRIVALRAKKAALLGSPSFAAWSLVDETAGTPGAVNKMLSELAPAALAVAKREAADIQKRIDAEAKAEHRKAVELQPWDWAYYAEKARKAAFDFSDAEVKPYFEMNRVLRDGVLYAAQELFGISFVERKDLPVYHPDVRVYEVREANGSPIGLLLFDLYRRDDKQGGAWCGGFVDQATLLGTKPVVTNNMNISKPAPGHPALLTFDEVTTMFHEFGHALHSLLTSVKYPLLSDDVPADFVELPSQANEMWSHEPAVLTRYAKHYRTGQPMPKDLLDKVLRARRYGQGFETLEYLEAAMLDQAWHQLPLTQTPAAAEVMAFEAKALAGGAVAYPPVPPRYHTTYFTHIFSAGYEAAYYAYVWSEVLARDVGAWFKERGGLTRANGDLYRAKILSRGRTKEPSELFRDFYGRGPEIGPLLEYRGLTLPKATRSPKKK